MIDTKDIISNIVMDVIKALKRDQVLNQRPFLPREALITPETDLPVHIVQRGRKAKAVSDCNGVFKYSIPLRISNVVYPDKSEDITGDQLYDFEARVADTIENALMEDTLSDYIVDMEFVDSDEKVIFDNRNPKMLKVFANSMVTQYNAYFEVERLG